ncbi:binding-protein-dependent transport systems inner membrane component [Chthoniobacter flavus Ellin428]|uniref:Binding-protein-dependent transport systems inner membrane component n=1 Tax=Chthoniobacter flavus Ellin428 TaxID=497964 RepID=B4D1S9_9BACT|nr:ABC transporter permease [Chthoniobacter flavus]EDY19691.1 binding-protein-dependent transport systems inner membrane component [Chthoniobacter flavus Ellin428]TCO92924.1 spermidine/putrescine transport system permease protein [Chthoniobacter flavus]
MILNETIETTPQQRRPGIFGWLLMTPMILWLVAFVVVPTAILLVYSFCQRDELGQVVYHFSWENYRRIFIDSDTGHFGTVYWTITLRSVIYAAFTTGVCLLLGYPVAWFIGRAPERRRNLLLTLVMIPFWTSFLVRTYAWITILSTDGLLNSFLQYTHLISEPFEMLYTPGAVVLGLIYNYLPFFILPVYGSIEKLDGSLIEASFDLGAGPLRTFQRVILPLTWPGIVAGILIVFIPAIGMFGITQLMGGGIKPTIGEVIQNQFLQARDWPFGAALGMTLVILFAAVYWFTARRQQTV